MSDDLSAIKLALGDRGEELGRDLFGKPSSRSRSEIRYGRKGSKCFRRKGGRWSFSDFETGEGGSLLDAIRVAHNTNFSGSLEIAKRWLGWSDDQLAERPRVLVPPAPKVVDEPDEDAEKLAAAKAIWSASGPIIGTPAEAYLISRGIEHWLDGPIRFHRKFGIVFAATNAEG